MRILSHRGYWQTEAEKNTHSAFRRSFEAGFGTETDIRDWQGQLIIAHNPPSPKVEPLLFTNFLALYKEKVGYLKEKLPLAINIKSCGLADQLLDMLVGDSKERAFFFDLAVPDAVAFLKRKARVFTRQSEYEPKPSFYEQSRGVWMDCFETDWMQTKDINKHLKNGKEVCIVSPELHGRKHLPVWERYKKLPEEVMLCTDYPEEARRFFL
jgi:hypothetical protein